jgi:hypothetical protein
MLLPAPLLLDREQQLRTVDKVSVDALSARAALGDRAAERRSRAGLGPELREVQRDQPVGPTRRAKDQGAYDPDGLAGPSGVKERWPQAPRQVRLSRKSSGSR